MAYLLHVHITDAGAVGLVPDSLADSAWATTYTNTIKGTPAMTNSGSNCSIYFFADETELDTWFAGTKVPAEHTATVDAWKTANSISVAYTLYDLSGSALDISGKAKY